MKKFNELTEDEIIEDALRAVPEYLESIRTTGVFQLENCVAAETKRIEKLYNAGIGVRQYSPLRKKELQDMDAFTAHFIPLLMERTRPIQQRYMQQRRDEGKLPAERCFHGYRTSNLYPTPQTVLRLHLSDTPSSFSRRRLTWTSTVRLSPK